MPNPNRPTQEHSRFGKLAYWLVEIWNQLRAAWIRFAESSQNAWWFPFVLGALVAFDAFVVVLPGDVMVALAVLSNPKGWRKTALVSAIGSALGAFALYLVIHHFGKEALDHMNASGLAQPSWQRARGLFKQYGLFSLALGSVIPGGTWPPVVLAGLSTDHWLTVFGWLFLGRFARFFLLSWGTREGWAMFQAVKQEALDQKCVRNETEPITLAPEQDSEPDAVPEPPAPEKGADPTR
jgi:membrane protein YqaA with SNARE-associated domain